MAFTKPKPPKYKKLPKRPAYNASKQTWDNYYRKLKEVQNYNRKLKQEYQKKLKEYERELQRRKKIAQEAQKKF